MVNETTYIVRYSIPVEVRSKNKIEAIISADSVMRDVFPSIDLEELDVKVVREDDDNDYYVL